MKATKTKKRHPSVSTGKRSTCKKQKKTFDSHTKRKRGKRVSPKGKDDLQLVLGNTPVASVYVSPSGKRVPFSIRIDSGIKKAWMQFILDKGLSSCEIVEKTLLGIMHGYQAPVYANHTINVIVDFPRVVKRVRRRQLYFEDEVEVVEGNVLDPGDVQPVLKCGFCEKVAVGIVESLVNGKKVFVCRRHQEELAVHSKWRVLNSQG